ncbi:MAG TPA: C40 family peptidase [Gaiellaceae bacterium]
MSGPRVDVTFSGSAGGAVGAARQTALAIDKVKVSAAGSSAPLRGMERDLGRVERGAFAGSGAFRGMGRSIAFASGAFLGAAGFVEVVKSSIDVVLASQTSLVKLDQAIKNAHASVSALTPIIDSHEASMRKLAFGDNETRDAEAKLVTAFGATKKAMDEVAVAADLARASNIPLADATRQLILLQEGNVRAAKQFGLSLPDLTKKQWEAKAAADGLNIAQEKGKVLYDKLLPRIKGQAAAFANSPAGKILEFQKQIEHLQESIGAGLLPVVNKYLTEVDAWLAKSSNQKKVTDDVKKVVHELAGALHDAKTATEDVLKVVNPVVHAFGGWKTVLEELVALKLAATLYSWAKAVEAFAVAEGFVTAATVAQTTAVVANTIAWEASGGGLLAIVPRAARAATAIEDVGVTATTATTRLGGLLKGLGAFAALASPLLILNALQGKEVAPYTDKKTGAQISYDPTTGQWYSGYPGKPRAKIASDSPQAVAASKYYATTAAGAPGGGGAPVVPGGTSTQKKEVAYATKYGPGSGITYTWGGVSPITGFDCSGYLMASYAAAGVTIPHNTVAQFNDPNAIVVLPGAEQPGDGVYFQSTGPGAAPQHVGIYIGNDKYIQYYTPGKVANVANLSTAGGYMGARRWLKIAAGSAASALAGAWSPYGLKLKTGGGGGTTAATAKKTPWVGATADAIIRAKKL